MSMYSVNTKQAQKLTKIVLAAGLVPFLMGSPGIGKSAIVKGLAEEANLKLIDYRASTGVPEDMQGLPFRNENFSEFLPFANIFPIKGISTVPEGYNGWLLFLDEMNAADRQMMAALYKVILDRQVGQYDLHPDVYIVTAGNRMSDQAITNSFGTAMQSRLIHLDIVSDTENWMLEVAYPQKYDHRVIAFISAFPTKLNDFNPDHTDNTFSCERTWEFVNRLTQQFDPNEPLPDWAIPLFAGTITSGVAVEFVQFTQVFKQIPSVKEVIANPTTCPIPSTSTLQWATVCSLAQNYETDSAEEILQYINRYPNVFRLVFARTTLCRNPGARADKHWVRLMIDIQKYLND